jgi:hypothetical protein
VTMISGMLSAPMPLSYLTDVEGQWNKIQDFARDNPWISLEDDDRIVVGEGAIFVFGGDAIDRGPAGRRIVQALLDAKRRQPDRVVLLAGNRDINKMRLFTELQGHPPPHAPPDLRGADLLRWIFTRTMGADQAFEHRRTELGLAGGDGAVSDEHVAQSYVDDLAPGGPLREYLAVCQLAWRSDETLFVHGGVTEENLGFAPGAHGRASDVDAWVTRLNAFYVASMDAFARGDRQGYAALVAYQAPVPGTRSNPGSVVYARLATAEGSPRLPPRSVIDRLATSGVSRVVIGHTPSGDCPGILRDGDFMVILADNSYGRVEVGSKVILDGPSVHVTGAVVLDDGTRADVDFTLNAGDAASPIGLVQASTGRLVKASLEGGDYLLFRALPGRRTEQLACPPDRLATSDLELAPRLSD